AANTTALTLSGLSHTGTDASSDISLTGTWNTTGAATGIFANYTCTSCASALLMNLQIGGSSRFSVDAGGKVISAGGLSLSSSSAGVEFDGTVDHSIRYYANGTQGIYSSGNLIIDTSAFLGFGGGFTSSATPMLNYDASGVIGQRNGTNVQALRVYNTYTSATSGEYGVFDWQTTANTLLIGTEKGSGGGSARSTSFVTGGTPALTIGTNQSIQFNSSVSFDGTPADCNNGGALTSVTGCLVILDNNGNTVKAPLFGTL